MHFSYMQEYLEEAFPLLWVLDFLKKLQWKAFRKRKIPPRLRLGSLYKDIREKPERDPDNLQGREKKREAQSQAHQKIVWNCDDSIFFSPSTTLRETRSMTIDCDDKVYTFLKKKGQYCNEKKTGYEYSGTKCSEDLYAFILILSLQNRSAVFTLP